MNTMIYLATDHRGYALKEKIKLWLTEWSMEFVDCGNTQEDPQDDYTDFIAIAAEKVSQDPMNNRAIILGHSGQGEAIVANRRRGVRAVVLYAANDDIVRLSREHNAANILSLGASFLSEDDAKHSIELWLKTEFSGDERHVRRIGKIDPQ
jgi:ribose 5-phosphate isomerase B